MTSIFNDMVERVTINTGNILSLINIAKYPGQNPTEELVQAIEATLRQWQRYPEKIADDSEKHLLVRRGYEDLMIKMTEEDRKDIKIGIKLFVSSDSQKNLHEAIDNVFSGLNIETIDNLIVSFKYSASENSTDSSDYLIKLQNIWKILQSYVKNEKINQIGLSDVDEALFRSIYEWADVKPSIIQINLATCCVVPPTLTNFCKDNEVQLLTHSDPTEILPSESISEIFPYRPAQFLSPWVLRFLVHIKCRGVLTIKGYLLKITAKPDEVTE